MRLDLHLDRGDGGVVVVTLSRRNLLALLAKLEQKHSLRTLVGGYVYESGALVDGVVLAVRAEPDECHYSGRQAPGGMLPDTEAAIRWADARTSAGEGGELP